MPIYDYRCTTCGHQSEERRGYDCIAIPCPLCGADAPRQAVQRVHIGGGPTTKFRLTEFQEANAEASYYHGKMENDRGQRIERRPLINMAANEARKRGAKIAKLPEGV